MFLSLLQRAKLFYHQHYALNQDRYRALEKKQSPRALVIACIDSRVNIYALLGLEPGESFVHRNPGNIVPDPSVDSGEGATIEFALANYPIEDVIVIGHSGCGAMNGLMVKDLDETLPRVAGWVKHAKPALHETARHEHGLFSPERPISLEALTKANIVLQMQHLKAYPEVQDRIKNGNLRVHGLYFSFATGQVEVYNKSENCFVRLDRAILDEEERQDVMNGLPSCSGC